MRLVLASSILFLLFGCSVGPARKSSTLYTIEVPEEVATPGEGGVLLVEVVGSSNLTSSRYVVYSKAPGQRGVYKTIKWASVLPDMFERQLLGRVGGYGEVTSLNGLVKADKLLRVEIDDFYLNSEGKMEIVGKVRAYLINQTSREVLRSRSFKSVTPVQDENLESIIGAFSENSYNVVGAVASWAGEL